MIGTPENRALIEYRRLAGLYYKATAEGGPAAPGNGEPGNEATGNGEPGNGDPGNGEPGNAAPGPGLAAPPPDIRRRRGRRRTRPGPAAPGGAAASTAALKKDVTFTFTITTATADLSALDNTCKTAVKTQIGKSIATEFSKPAADISVTLEAASGASGVKVTVTITVELATAESLTASILSKTTAIATNVITDLRTVDCVSSWNLPDPSADSAAAAAAVTGMPTSAADVSSAPSPTPAPAKAKTASGGASIEPSAVVLGTSAIVMLFMTHFQ